MGRVMDFDRIPVSLKIWISRSTHLERGVNAEQTTMRKREAVLALSGR
jgi:hypothetical protein